jgi:hypothetical protein
MCPLGGVSAAKHHRCSSTPPPCQIWTTGPDQEHIADRNARPHAENDKHGHGQLVESAGKCAAALWGGIGCRTCRRRLQPHPWSTPQHQGCRAQQLGQHSCALMTCCGPRDACLLCGLVSAANIRDHLQHCTHCTHHMAWPCPGSHQWLTLQATFLLSRRQQPASPAAQCVG